MRRQSSFFLLTLFFIIVSCSGSVNQDKEFEALANNYIARMLELNPEWATSLGEHRFDGMLNDRSLEGLKQNRDFNQAYLDSLVEIKPANLSPSTLVDYELLTESIRYSIFSNDTLKGYEWNPRHYNVGGAIYSLLAREFAPLEDRLMRVKERLQGVPQVLADARKNLKRPPRIFTETAIQQNAGTISLIRDGLNEFIGKSSIDPNELKDAQDMAVAELEKYGIWLKDTLLPISDGEFRLGSDIYRAKLRYALNSDLSPETILARAESDLAATKEEMYNTALPLFKEYFPDDTAETVLSNQHEVIQRVIDRLADAHPNEDNMVEVIKGGLDECIAFVRDHNLVSLPDEPLDVIVMPEFERGVAIGYCDSPGPLEKGTKTFYAISPPPADWTEEKVESYFREYNDHMLYDLTLHEAMPGHYLQIAHSNALKAPTMVRAILGSGTFVEGWATYAEQLMVEQGFKGPELKMQQLKMRLRMIINAIIDQKIHTAGMTEEEAMNMMQNDGFQEEGEAAGKWRRACLTSTQLSTYYVGNIEINDIRDAYREKYGDDFNMLEFHDLMLSFGSPTPAQVKRLMGLSEPSET